MFVFILYTCDRICQLITFEHSAKDPIVIYVEDIITWFGFQDLRLVEIFLFHEIKYFKISLIL